MSVDNISVKPALKTPKAAALIALKIKRDIVTRNLAEGQLLPPELELMQEFGVSRPTIREVYRILEADRLVGISRGANGGAVVHRPDPQLITEHIMLVLGWEQTSVSDFYEARAAIEPEMARAVACAGRAPVILQDILDRAYVSITNSNKFAQILTEFHTTLSELAGNQLMKYTAAAMHEVILRHKALVLTQLRRGQKETEFFSHAELGLKSYKKLITLIEQKKTRRSTDTLASPHSEV